MPTFDDRENAFETKFAHDSEMQFRAEARRNKLAGLWAAGLMGKSDDEAAAYAMDVVSADFEEAGNEDVVRKLVADLAGKASADEVRAKLAELLPVAKAQLLREL
ncbi:MAG: aldolase [Rhodobacterales bacterium 32-66-7]|nr:MAG: aldolase [Rhodobacterales bacterium 32-66-7]OZA07828.1 MAG: aldolase [Rhodobacterales bacterium 17-64-5]